MWHEVQLLIASKDNPVNIKSMESFPSEVCIPLVLYVIFSRRCRLITKVESKVVLPILRATRADQQTRDFCNSTMPRDCLPPEANTVYWLLHAHQGHNFMPFVRGPTL
jgi:hypothetical protein